MKVSFAIPGTVLDVPGFGRVHDGNLTVEKYEALLKISEGFKIHFKVENNGGLNESGTATKVSRTGAGAGAGK